MISNEKKEFAGWWIFVVIMLLLSIATFTVFKPLQMMFDRKVQVESHQYQESRYSEIDTFRASLAKINVKLTDTTLTQSERINLQSQKAMIESQISAAQSKLNRN